MQLSEICSADQWRVMLAAAGGNVEKAKVFAAIGWHETHFGRTPGYGQEGYILGVGAWGGGQAQFQGLEAQVEWTANKLGSQESYSLADMQWYGRTIQKPTSAGGVNTGDAWGKSVYSVYSSLVVDLAAPDAPSAPAVPDVSEAMKTEWAKMLVGAFLLFAAAVALKKD